MNSTRQGPADPIMIDFVAGGWSGPTQATGADLDTLYAHPPGDGRGFVRSNFVASLDGSAQGDDGRSGTLNTPADGSVFATLRAHADAVLVGAGTVRAEGYRAVDLEPWQRELRSDLGLAPYPLLVVVSGSLSVDPGVAKADTDDHGDVVIMTTATHDEAALAPYAATGIEVVAAGDVTVDIAGVVAWLVDRGLPRILTEGGAGLNHKLLAADLVDDVCLTFSAKMVGGEGGRTVTGSPLLPNPAFALQHLLHSDDGALLTRYLRARAT